MIILDLDNCISDDGWRIPFIKNEESDVDKKYHDYHSLAPFDKPGNLDLIGRYDSVIISTARPEAWRLMTEQWLYRNGIRHFTIFMRKENDHRPAVDIKRDNLFALMNYIRLDGISCAYDDREDIVEMYKEVGIKNAQVKSIHNIQIHQ